MQPSSPHFCHYWHKSSLSSSLFSHHIFAPLLLCQYCIFLSCTTLTLLFNAQSADAFCWKVILSFWFFSSDRWICRIWAGPARAPWPTRKACRWYCPISRLLPPCLSTRAAYRRRAPLQREPTAVTAAAATATTAAPHSQTLCQSSWNPSLIQWVRPSPPLHRSGSAPCALRVEWKESEWAP